jgi:hypothetical protein
MFRLILFLLPLLARAEWYGTRTVRFTDGFDMTRNMSTRVLLDNITYYGSPDPDLARSRSIAFALHSGAEGDVELALARLKIHPLWRNGSIATDSACISLSWVNIQPILRFTSKSDLSRCVGCHTLPVCDGRDNCDGFGITKEDLFNLCPAPGWAFTVAAQGGPDYRFILFKNDAALIGTINDHAGTTMMDVFWMVFVTLIGYCLAVILLSNAFYK